MDLLRQALESTDRGTDEQILIAALTSFAFRADIRIKLDELDGEHFYNKDYGKIWDRAKKLASEDRIITMELLKKGSTVAQKRLLDAVEGQSIRMVEVDRGIELIRAAYKNRQLVEVLKRACDSIIQTEGNEALGALHAELGKLDEAEKPADDCTDMLDAVVDFWEEIEQPVEEREPLILTPWSRVDDRLNGGLRRRRSYVFCGRPGAGKSIALLQIAGWAAEQGRKVAVFSGEMDKSEVTKRILSAGAKANYGQVTRGEVDEHNANLLSEYSHVIKDRVLRIFDPPYLNMNYIRQQCALMQRTVGLDVVVIDYQQIVQPTDSKKMPREQQVGETSTAIKVLARSMNAVCVSGVQLNRGDSRNPDARPGQHDIRESDRIVHDADALIILHHPENKPGDVEFLFAKNRTGTKGIEVQGWAASQARID